MKNSPNRTAREKLKSIGVRSLVVVAGLMVMRMPINMFSSGELVACANRSDVARREKFAETFGITGYADAEQMLRVEQPDLVHLVAYA